MRTQSYIELSGGIVIATATPEMWTEGKKLLKNEGARKFKAYARDRLLEILTPGDTVFTILRHVSQSGMSRRIDLYAIQDNGPRYLSGYASTVLDMKLSDKGGIVTGGCGMDMGFDLVYRLGAALWPNGTDKPHGTRNGEPDSNGGYALKHQWI
jgi:hypothetical protein